MTIHLEELQWARAHEAQTKFPELSDEQVSRIMTRGRELHSWFKSHFRTHCFINAMLLTALLVTDYLLVLRFPGIWLVPGSSNPLRPVLLASVITAALRGWVTYSMTLFTIHEGAAHKAIFPPVGPLSRLGHFLSSNLCRIGGSDPEHYAPSHMKHHAKFGTEEDAEFLNFVAPRRYMVTFLPFAIVINFSDFIVHRPAGVTRSSLVTALASLVYQGSYIYLTYRSWGMLFVVVETLLFIHMGFYLERGRQFTEHNLMPLDNLNGSRSFGMGFWGMLMGGGPWGQPCHWEHHMVASIPWYQQLILHRFVVRLLTPEQREQFLLEPVIGFPKLWWRLLRGTRSFALPSLTEHPWAAR